MNIHRMLVNHTKVMEPLLQANRTFHQCAENDDKPGMKISLESMIFCLMSCLTDSLKIWAVIRGKKQIIQGIEKIDDYFKSIINTMAKD